MRFFNPPHAVQNLQKLKKMREAIKDGDELPPIVVCGEKALTGTHRIAAYYWYRKEVPYIEIEEILYIEAVKAMGLDPIYDEVRDYSKLAEKIHELTDDGEIKAALADQF